MELEILIRELENAIYERHNEKIIIASARYLVTEFDSHLLPAWVKNIAALPIEEEEEENVS